GAAMSEQHATAHPHRYAASASGNHHAGALRSRLFRRSFDRAVHVVLDRYLLFPIGALIAIVWANLAPESYFTMTRRVSFLVNEIGMAFFFALLAQEVVEAVMPGGALHSWRRWSMPIAAALGGMAGAALVYLAFVHLKYETVLTAAWPITCAI